MKEKRSERERRGRIPVTGPPSCRGNHLWLSQREKEQRRRAGERRRRAGREEESMSFLQGPMLRVANCRNERNGMMESHKVLVLCLWNRATAAKGRHASKNKSRETNTLVLGVEKASGTVF